MAENENNVELEEQVELNKEKKEKKVKEKSNKKKGGFVKFFKKLGFKIAGFFVKTGNE